MRRELAEEAGYAAARLTRLCSFFTSKSVLDETAALYLAEGLTPTDHRPDPTEFVDVRAFPLREALGMVEIGEIRDAMTIITILHAAPACRLTARLVSPVHDV